MDRTIKKMCEDIRKGNAPKNLLVGTSTLPEKIGEYLPDYNFEMFYQQTGMAIDLEAFDFESGQDGCDIRRVRDEDQLEEWLATLNEAFGANRNKEFFELFLREEDTRLYACYHKDSIVSAAMLFKKDDVAGIHQVGTLRAYRKKGFGTLVVKKALMDAKQSGCTIGVLQASDLGKSVYEAMGFTEYGKIRHWEYKG